MRIFRTFISRFLVLFLWISSAFMLMALDPDKTISQYSVHTWNIEGGLPGNSVFDVEQTRDGYLWLGTQDGLVRFDGINFELYNKKKIHQLKCNMIRALYRDRNGTLWIGTDSGGLTRYKQGQFTTYPISENNALFKIKAINEDRWGNLWIGSFTGGLTCFHSGKFTTYTTKQGLPHNQVTFIYKDTNGDLWVTTAAGIVKLLQPGVFQGYALRDILPYMKTVCLYDTDTMELWIGTGERGLFQLKAGKFTAYGTESGLPHPTITCIYKDRMKNLWIGTDGGGLTRMRDGVFSTLSGGDGLACGFISSITEDKEGSLWVGTLDGGLHQLKDGKFTNYTTREGLVHDYINCICESRANCLRIGTKAGVNQLKDGKLTTILTTGKGLLDEVVECLYEDPAGHLWIGTWRGLQRFKPGHLDTFTKKHGLSDNRIKCILGDRQGNLWIGTENGLNRRSYNNNKWTIFSTKQGLSGNIIHFLFEDGSGTLWISTNGGLNTLKDGDIAVYNLETGIENNVVRCVYEDKEGVPWFGADSGLIRLKNHQTSLYTDESGLVENYVCSILEDERGYLWLAGRNGISRIKKKELEDFSRGKIHRLQPNRYNEIDGMKSGWCTGAGCKTRDGRFWFPTSKGVTVVHPHHIATNKHPPSPMIEKLIVDGESVKIKSFLGGPGGRFFKKAPLAAGGKNKPLKLAPGKKRLEFYYTAVSFINPQKIKFKIRLKGYDDDWIEMGTIRSTTYTGLPPGNYSFEVTACNPDGIWNETGASFSFYLSPHFSQTPWFYVLVALLVFLAAFSLYRFRVRQLQAKKKELGKMVEIRTKDLKERTTELEKTHQSLQQTKEVIEEKNRQLEEQSEKLTELDQVKSRFFANISHEFRTPLTLIMGPLEQMLSQSTDHRQKKKLGMMIRNSQRLLGLINQLLELSKIQNGTMKLRISRQNIVPFLKGIRSAFELLADKKEVDLTFFAEKENIPLYFDPERLEVVVCNLLMNALKFTPPGGQVKVSVREYPPGSVGISVSDTGPGIPRDQITSIFDHFYQLDGLFEDQKKGFGIGLALAKEFITLHHGEIQVNSREGSGAEFVVRLPLGKDHLEPGTIVDLPETAPPPGDQPAIAERLVSMLDLERQEPEPDSLVNDQPGKDIVLVVEDSVDMRQYIKNALEPGYKVEEAVDGREGIDKAQKIIPDLIISDIMMPEVDGCELCRVLKNHRDTSHVPIILLTAKAAEENIIEGLETGADDYITKPFNTTILCARIKNLVNLRRHLQQTIDREMTLQPTKMAVSPVDKEFMAELKAVIDKNLSEPDFSVEELSKKLYMSHSTLYRKIYALTGETPRDFIRSYRLKRGAELLKTEFGNVGDVAFDVGFNSTSYFIKCFKEKFHQLPSRFQTSD